MNLTINEHAMFINFGPFCPLPAVMSGDAFIERFGYANVKRTRRGTDNVHKEHGAVLNYI